MVLLTSSLDHAPSRGQHDLDPAPPPPPPTHTLTQRGHKASASEYSYVWYQIEGLYENLNITLWVTLMSLSHLQFQPCPL